MLSKVKYLLEFLRFHRVHTRSRAAIEEWQTDRLRTLIPYLEDNVPFYSKLLHSCEVQARDIVMLLDLPKLPITNKSMFIGKLPEEYTDNNSPLLGNWVTTSGTTGAPFTPLRRKEVRMLFFGDSLHYRFLMRERPWAWDTNWARIAHIRIFDRQRDTHLVIPVKDFLSDPQSALEKLVEFQPYVIESHALLLYELAKAAKKYDSPLRPRYAIAGSEHLSLSSRRFVEKALGCEVYNRYGLEEVGTVAMECVVHDGNHINCESFIIEIVDDDEKVLPEGSWGRVLVTDLYNNQMPFVRYDSGDRGRISWEKCSCGLEAPRLWIEGRYAAFLTFGERRFHHFEFDAKLDSFMNDIIQYQITKQADNALLMRIIPGPAFKKGTLPIVHDNIAELVGPSIRVRVEIVTHISRVPRGKSQILVDESRDSACTGTHGLYSPDEKNTSTV